MLQADPASARVPDQGFRLLVPANPTPWDPTVTRTAHPSTTRPYRAFVEFSNALARAAAVAGIAPLAGPLRVTAYLRRRAPLAARGLMSNLARTIEEAGVGLLWREREQIALLTIGVVEFGPDAHESAVIEVEPWRGHA